MTDGYTELHRSIGYHVERLGAAEHLAVTVLVDVFVFRPGLHTPPLPHLLLEATHPALAPHLYETALSLPVRVLIRDVQLFVFMNQT